MRPAAPDAFARALLERKLVDEDDLAALGVWEPYAGARLVERVVRAGLVPDDEVVATWRSLGAIDASAELLAHPPSTAALGLFPRALAERHRALPMRLMGRRVVVAMLDPSDSEALERLAMETGYIVEPRCVRPALLVERIARAYDVRLPGPDPAFLAHRRASTSMGSGPHPMPAPGPRRPRLPEPIDAPAPRVSPAPLDDDGMPARRIPRVDVTRLRDLERAPPTTRAEARDLLPPLVLSVLVPPLRAAILFVVRDARAVGWDAVAPGIDRARVRDVLLPLGAASVFADAVRTGHIATGNISDPTTMERSLFRFLSLPAPRAFAVAPVRVGEHIIALLYVDRDDGRLDGPLLDDVRDAAGVLAAGLAPFVVDGELLPLTAAAGSSSASPRD